LRLIPIAKVVAYFWRKKSLRGERIMAGLEANGAINNRSGVTAENPQPAEKEKTTGQTPPVTAQTENTRQAMPEAARQRLDEFALEAQIPRRGQDDCAPQNRRNEKPAALSPSRRVFAWRWPSRAAGFCQARPKL
jgi:hypothetical protein